MKMGKKNKASLLENFILLFLFVTLIGFMPTSKSTDKYISLLAIILFILYGVFKKGTIKVSKSILWYTILILFGGLSCIWSKDTTRYIYYLINSSPIVISIIILIGKYVEDENDVDRLLKLMVYGGCIAGIRYLFYTDISSIFSSGYYLRGTFGSLLDNVTNYNNYTSPLCLACIIASYYTFYKKEKWGFIPFILLTAILIFSGSRKTIITIPLISMMFIFMQGNIKEKIKSLVFIIILFIISLSIINNFEFLSQIRERLYSLIINFFQDNKELDNSSRLRMIMIENAKRVWNNHLLFGVGWDNFRYYGELGNATAHNGYYEVLASLGITGFIFYFSLYCKNIICEILNFVRKKSDENTVFIIGFILSLLFLEIGSALIYNKVMTILFLIFITFVDISRKKYIKIVNRKECEA